MMLGERGIILRHLGPGAVKKLVCEISERASEEQVL